MLPMPRGRSFAEIEDAEERRQKVGSCSFAVRNALTTSADVLSGFVPLRYRCFGLHRVFSSLIEQVESIGTALPSD